MSGTEVSTWQRDLAGDSVTTVPVGVDLILLYIPYISPR